MEKQGVVRSPENEDGKLSIQQRHLFGYLHSSASHRKEGGRRSFVLVVLMIANIPLLCLGAYNESESLASMDELPLFTEIVFPDPISNVWIINHVTNEQMMVSPPSSDHTQEDKHKLCS